MRLNRKGFTPLEIVANGRKRKFLTGFTLIELIIVIVIIGVLAGISAPMIANTKVKAICAESLTALGTLRTTLRAYYVTYNGYPQFSEWIANLSESNFRIYFPGLENANALTGTYFGKQCYFYQYISVGGGLYFVSAYMAAGSGQPSDAPRAAEAAAAQDGPGGYLRMDVKTGIIYQFNVKRSGY